MLSDPPNSVVVLRLFPPPPPLLRHLQRWIRNIILMPLSYPDYCYRHCRLWCFCSQDKMYTTMIDSSLGGQQFSFLWSWHFCCVFQWPVVNLKMILMNSFPKTGRGDSNRDKWQCLRLWAYTWSAYSYHAPRQHVLRQVHFLPRICDSLIIVQTLLTEQIPNPCKIFFSR